MNYENQQTEAGNRVYPNATLETATSFSASSREIFCALLMYVVAYFYVLFLDTERFLPVTAILLTGITELLFWDKKPSLESFMWLACFACAVIGRSLSLSSVWGDGQLYLFVHVFFVWWVLSRSGRLIEGRSGHLLPIDILNGFVIIPFSNYLKRARVAFFALRLLSLKKDGGKKSEWGWVTALVILCLCLFAGAFRLLLDADGGFRTFLLPVEKWLHFQWDEDLVVRLIFSLPVGSWLFGLLDGAFRLTDEQLTCQRKKIDGFLVRLQKVSERFWLVVIGAFSLLYVLFFAVQGRYLFGAFTRTLPDGFVVSQYARQGFFELCKVIAVNFTLLWLVTRMTRTADVKQRGIRTGCILILIESMVFAVIALSKLWLYISCFGFTPLRLQSTWLACVLLSGCILWLYHILSGRPAMRIWMAFSAVSLSVLCFL